MFKKVIAKIKSYRREHGALVLIKRIIWRIISSIFYTQRLDFFCISGTPLTQLQARCPLEIRKGGAKDMDMFLEISMSTSGNSDRTTR